MAEREELLRAVQGARTGPELAAAVAALDAHDQARTAAIARSRETDLSATAVRETLTPLPAFERHTAATDWLGEYEAPRDYRTAMITEASRWYRSIPPELSADPEEFQEQALGRAYTAASAYGDYALDARREFMTYLGYLTRQGASGLPQIQQTVDPHDNPAETPLQPMPFDNFAPEQNEYNAGIESPDHTSQVDSERAPQIQQIEQQNGSGSGFGSGPERADEHTTSLDLADSYAEVPLGKPGQIPTIPSGAAVTKGQSAPNPVLGENQDEGSERRPNVVSAAYTAPDQEGFRWRTGSDTDTFDAPYHERCASLHWPEEACHHGIEHTASVAVGYLMNAEDFTRRARFESLGMQEGEAILRLGSLEKVAAHHDAIMGGFRVQARTGDEIAWLHGYLARVRPVLAGDGNSGCPSCGGKSGKNGGLCTECLQANANGKGKKKKGKNKDKAGVGAQGSRLDFPDAPAGVAAEAMRKGAPFAGYEDFAACVRANRDKDNPDAYCGKIKHQVEGHIREAALIRLSGPDLAAAVAEIQRLGASGLPQIQQFVDSHDNPDPGGDQLNQAVMFPLNPASGEGGEQSKEAARSGMTPSTRAVQMFGRLDAMDGKRPHHKEGYPFSNKAHGQYLRGWNETRGSMDAVLSRDPISKEDYAEWTGRPDLHQHYLGVYSQVKAGRAGADIQAEGSRRTADFMTRPHQSTDDLNPPFNSAATTPQEPGGDYDQGVRDGQEDARAGEHPTFADNSGLVSPYVKGYAVGYSGRPPDTGVQDVPRSMGGDSGQAMNAQEAQTAFMVSKASLQRTAACIGCGHMSHLGEPCGEYGCTHQHHPGEMGGGPGSHAVSIPSNFEYRGLPDDRYQVSRRPQWSHQDEYYGSGNRHDDSGYESDYGRYGPNGEDYDPGGYHAGSLQRQAHDFTEEGRENAEHSLGSEHKLPVNSLQDLKNAHTRAHQVKGIPESRVDAYLDRLDKEYDYGGGDAHAHDRRAASRRPVSAAFLTRQAVRDPDFRKGYKFAARWQPGQRLVAQGSAAFEAGLYAAVSDRPAIQGAWAHEHHRLSQRYPVLGSRLDAHASFTVKFATASPDRYRVTGNGYLVPAIKRTAGTSVDLITDGPGTSPDPMGSTPLNGPGTPPPMGGGEDPARSGGAPPYQMGGSAPVAPDDVIGAPQEPPQESGPFTQTFSGRHPGNADLAPAAPNTAGGPGYENTDAYQGDPQRYQQAMAFRRRVQASLTAQKAG